jgi:tetratricopeptide (TPR) repeat protein
VAWKAGHKNECAGYKAAMEHAREQNTKKHKMLKVSEMIRSGENYILNTSDLSSCVDDGLQAIEQLEQAKALAEEVGNETIRSQWRATKNLAACFERLGQIEKAVQLFEHCLVISKTKAYRKSHPDFIFDDGEIFQFLGRSFLYLGQFEKALGFLEKAMKIAKQSDHDDLSVNPTQLGNCCRYARTFTVLFVCVSVTMMSDAECRMTDSLVAMNKQSTSTSRHFFSMSTCGTSKRWGTQLGGQPLQ